MQLLWDGALLTKSATFVVSKSFSKNAQICPTTISHQFFPTHSLIEQGGLLLQ